jgi:hypothetical protein
MHATVQCFLNIIDYFGTVVSYTCKMPNKWAPLHPGANLVKLFGVCLTLQQYMIIKDFLVTDFTYK